MSNYRLISIKKVSGRYEVGIKANDETYYFKISEDLLIESRFFSEKDLSEQEYSSFLSKIPLDSLIYDAEKYADRKMRTEKEVKDHLFEKTTSKTMVDKAIEVIKKKGLINDEAYKSSYIEYAIYSRRDGILKISQDLKQLGINPGYIDYPIDALKDNLKTLTVKYSSGRKEPKQALFQKLKIYLMARGYTESEIDKYVSYSMIPSINEEDLIVNEYKKLKQKYKGDNEKIRDSLRRKGFSSSLIRNILGGEDE